MTELTTFKEWLLQNAEETSKYTLHSYGNGLWLRTHKIQARFLGPKTEYIMTYEDVDDADDEDDDVYVNDDGVYCSV
jgi:hypothetical protein